MEILRVCIAGYGVVGKRRHQDIDAHPKMKVVAVCDQAFSEKIVDEKGMLCFTNYHDLLNEKLDILERNGFAQSKIKLDNFIKSNNQLQANLLVDVNKIRKINAINFFLPCLPEFSTQ